MSTRSGFRCGERQNRNPDHNGLLSTLAHSETDIG